MRRGLIAFGAFLLLVSLTYGQATRTEDFVEKPFRQGGKIDLRLASGSYKIRAGISDRIYIHWLVNKPSDIEGIRVRVDTAESTADIRTDGPARRADFVIEIPMRSDIFVRMRAGEIKITGLEGNKEISMTAGELDIETDPTAYQDVRASVTFGDLSASAFHISKSGIGSSFDWQGGGIYRLKASLFAGEMNIGSGRPD